MLRELYIFRCWGCLVGHTGKLLRRSMEATFPSEEQFRGKWSTRRTDVWWYQVWWDRFQQFLSSYKPWGQILKEPMLIRLDGQNLLSIRSEVPEEDRGVFFWLDLLTHVSSDKLTPQWKSEQTKMADQHCCCWRTEVWWCKEPADHSVSFLFRLLFCVNDCFYFKISFCLCPVDSRRFLVLLQSHILLHLISLKSKISVCDCLPTYLMWFLTLSDRRFISLLLNRVTAEWSQRWGGEASAPKCLI